MSSASSSLSTVSLVSLTLIVLLFVSELSLYLSVETVDHLFVDVSTGEKLRINFDVTFAHIPCSRQCRQHTADGKEDQGGGLGSALQRGH